MKAKLINEYLDLSVLAPKSKEDVIRDLSKLSKDELNDKLLDVSLTDKAYAIEAILNAGADIEYCDKGSYDWTALMYAVGYGQLNVVKALIDFGANVNVSNENGLTPLMIAVQRGKKNMIKTLIDAGADVNARDSYGYSILHITNSLMKYFIKKCIDERQKTNESVAFKPKLKEDIRKEFKFNDVKFVQSNSVVDGSFQGTIMDSYEHLFKLFGEPDLNADDKVKILWNVEDESGFKAYIYSYRTHLSINQLKNMESFEWHIGCNDKQTYRNLMAFILYN
jgi:hypothetical protein